MKPSVSIIILNWNGWKDTLECLESMYQINYPAFQVIVVDNHSKDESLEKIRQYCQGKITPESTFYTYNPENKPIKIKELNKSDIEKDLEENPVDAENGDSLILIKNDANYGFAHGNNIAIRYTLKKDNPDYVLLLNNDTVLDSDFLDELVKTAETEPQIGILGPLIYYYDADGRRDVVANLGGKVNVKKYPGYYDLRETNSLGDYPGKFIECDWVSGAALLLKSKELPIKLLNEKLFFGCEDIDLALVLKEYGYKAAVVPGSHIWHKEGVSRKKRSSGGAKRALMEIKSNLTFLKTHNPHYYPYLPLYLLQIFVLYLNVMVKRS